jgi:hypothetical protein
MSSLIDTTSNILSQNTICFETRNVTIPVPIEDAKFGILNFTAVTAEETADELDFLLIVDCSGSMSDICSDGRSKMQHIIHTLKNIVLFFHQHLNPKFHVTINAFDTQIYSIVARTNITYDNINEIISKIDTIIPHGRTNIEFALKKSAEEINKLTTEFPNTIVNHIFMTDGDATDGSRVISVLQSIVNPDITNEFIGFGLDHDAALLNGLSSVGKSAYYFIDKLESAGLVYGEILHSILYKLLTDSEITIENGLIYNFKTNTWVESLMIGNIISESNKTYNIISTNPDECKVNIKGMMNGVITTFQATLIESTDLSVQVYRQRTLQLLYKVNDFCTSKRNLDDQNQANYFGIIDYNIERHEDMRKHEKSLKLELASLMQEMKKYMHDNNLQDDKILKNLCDDIYICFRTFGTRFETMYCSARQTSQGTQRQYTASSINDDLYDNEIFQRQTPGIPILQRGTNAVHFEDDDFELPIIQHTLTDFDQTPYLTQHATQIMREISRNDQSGYDDDDISVLTQEIN